MTGYSGTSLAKKIGLKPGTKLYAAGASENYLQLLAPLPKGVQVVRRIGSKTDIVHIFASERARLSEALRSSLAEMRPDGAIWVSWPKKASRKPTSPKTR